MLLGLVFRTFGAVFEQIADGDELHAFDGGKLGAVAGTSGADADAGDMDRVEFGCCEFTHVAGVGGAAGGGGDGGTRPVGQRCGCGSNP